MPHDTRHTFRTRRQMRTGTLYPYPTVYFLIVTDARETEKNYLNGIKKALPADLQNRVALKIVHEKKPANLVEACLRFKNTEPQYNSQMWIVLDCDEVPDFDAIIHMAEWNEIHVAWSNPCIETWFSAYFENIHSSIGSKQCIDEFKEIFKKKTDTQYLKNDPDIYRHLMEYGNEEMAIKRAEQKRKEFGEMGITQPSRMCPATNVDRLVHAIKRCLEPRDHSVM